MVRISPSSRPSPARPVPEQVIELAVDMLATYRLTRLATTDAISETVRLSILRRVGVKPDDGDPDPSAVELVDAMSDPPRLASLVTCRWCAGVWIAAGVTLARNAIPELWEPVGRGLALSSAAVLLSRLEG